ncbi:MAG: TIGR00730 family Rossman fold protein [Alphaproteobacteria bacterium]
MNYKVPDREAAMRPALCVFCGSNHGNDPAYTEAARRFGALMAKNGFDLVFGGGGVGLMGELARAVHEGGAKVTGIIPDFLRHLEPPMRLATELVVTRDMNERKSRMFAAADAFVALPGGLGTLDELAEALTAAQLRTHGKPVVFINVKRFFDPFFAFIDHLIAHDFASPSIRELFRIVATPEEAIALLRESLRPASAADGARAQPAQARARRSRT